MTAPSEMSRTERDVLLHSSGELPAWRSLTLRWRLARDPAAMELAETLALTELCLARRPAMASLPRASGLLAAGVAAAALLLILASGPREEASAPGTVIKLANASAVPDVPTTLRALRRTLEGTPALPAKFQALRQERAERAQPIFPRRASYLDVRAPRFQPASVSPTTEDR